MGDLECVLKLLKSLFASIPYSLHIAKEAYYHSIFYTFMALLGFDIVVEALSSRGRVDAVLEFEDKVYVMEFKYTECVSEATDEEKEKIFSSTLEQAINQINNRGYSDKYIGTGKEIYKVAFAFLGRDNIEMRVER